MSTADKVRAALQRALGDRPDLDQIVEAVMVPVMADTMELIASIERPPVAETIRRAEVIRARERDPDPLQPS